MELLDINGKFFYQPQKNYIFTSNLVNAALFNNFNMSLLFNALMFNAVIVYMMCRVRTRNQYKRLEMHGKA